MASNLNVGNIIISILANPQQLQSGLNNAVNQINNFGSRASRAFQAINASMAGLAIGTVIKDLGTSVVQTQMNFESAMSRVGALSGATQDELEKLTAQAKKLGAETSFTATQAAEGQQFLAMAGYKTNQIVEAMPGLLSTAAAGQLELGRTADIVSNILSGYGIAADETNMVADRLTATFTSSNTTLETLGNSMMHVGPKAKAMGQDFEGTLAVLAMLGNAGDQMEAGSHFGTVIMNLTAGTKKGAKLLEKYGIEVFDSTGKTRQFVDILEDLEKVMAGMTDEEKFKFLKPTFMKDGTTAILSLINQGGSAKLREMQGKIEDSDGKANEIAAKQLDNLKGSITILKSALEGLSIQFGEILNPYIRKVADGLTYLVGVFAKTNPAVKKAVVIVLALVGAFAGLMALIAPIGFMVMGIQAAFSMFAVVGGAFSFLLGPIGLVILAITALGLAFWYLWKNNLGGFKDKLKAVGKWFVDTYNNIKNAVKKLVAMFKAGELDGAIDKLSKVFFLQFGWLIALFKALHPSISKAIKSVSDFLKTHSDKISSIFSGLWNDAKKFFNDLISIPKEFYDEWFKNGPSKAFELLGQKVAILFKDIVDIYKGWFDASKEAGELVYEYFSTLDLKTAFSDMLEDADVVLDDYWSYFKRGWADAFDRATIGISDFGNWIKDNWYHYFDPFIWAGDFIKGFADQVLLDFFDMEEGIYGVLKNIGEFFYELLGIKNETYMKIADKATNLLGIDNPFAKGTNALYGTVSGGLSASSQLARTSLNTNYDKNPVINNNKSNSNQVVNHNTIHVNGNDTNKMKEQLKEILEDEQYTKQKG